MTVKNYYNLIDWSNKAVILEPPITFEMDINRQNIDDLAQLKLSQHLLKYELKIFPSNTQAVERTIKIVTEASLTVCGEENREGFILSILKSRNSLPNFQSKKDYVKKKRNSLKKFSV